MVVNDGQHYYLRVRGKGAYSHNGYGFDMLEEHPFPRLAAVKKSYESSVRLIERLYLKAEKKAGGKP